MKTMPHKPKKPQDDRYLKQLHWSERRKQEELRVSIKHTLDYLYASAS